MNAHEKFIIRCRGVILNDGKLLVVKHTREADYYALPGGHLNSGEDVKECLRREILEELGIEPKIGKLLYINTFIDKGNVQPVEFFFEVINAKEYIDFEKLTRSHAHELFDICWADITDTIRILPQKIAEDFKNGEILSNEVRYISNIKKLTP
ncbi:MAG: DNA mismatch repair protein MutT [Parcubacteria group bacterium Gr01-1014_56]|nr:MAG: DNA mismatch repair protein MutT [Parcubacteria group bacterium Gr01-1014_56]